jgi:phospholipid/cholesterol/gamma-HCH transport system substrate-binding protein
MARGLAGFTQGAKVALFVIVLGVASWLIYRMVSKDSGGKGGYTVYTHLKDATGLVNKSRVKIAGIPVGYIDGITLDRDEAKVTIRMDKDVPLHVDATAAKRSSSLLGDQILVLTPGTEGNPKLKDGDEIKNAVESASTDKIMADLAVIADRVKAVSIQAANAFGTDEGGKQMKEILKNLSEVSKEINETVKENRRSVTETIKNIEKITERSAPKVDKILANVESVTGDFKDLLEANPEKYKGDPNSSMASIHDTLEKLNAASKNLDSTMHHADSILGRIDRGEGTFGRLTKDETLINEVEGVASDIHDFTSGLTRVQTIIGLRSEYYIRSNGFKSYVELRLQPREDKYYLIELVNDPRGKTSITQLDVASTNPNAPPFYREVRTETKNDFRISFMFARRLGPATFLFGIRESSGGIGLNLHAFEDRLELASDLFGFGENVRPRWRERASFEFVKRLWVVMGMDELLNPDRTEWFFGGMLRFNDEDLKSILPFAPVRP